MRHQATSLANVTSGKALTVRRILFEGLRAYCAERGLHDGARVTLLEVEPAAVLLGNTDGTRVRCPTAYARFVEVAPQGGR